MDNEVSRLQREVEDFSIRLRNVENLDTRAMRELLDDVKDIQTKLDRMEREGTTATLGELRSIRRTLQRHEDELARKADADIVKEQAAAVKDKADAAIVQEMREDTKSNRKIVLAAVVGTAFSIGAWLIQWLISRGHP